MNIAFIIFSLQAVLINYAILTFNPMTILSNVCFGTNVNLSKDIEFIPVVQNFKITSIKYQSIHAPEILLDNIKLTTSDSTLNYTFYYIAMSSLSRVNLTDSNISESYYPLKILIKFPSDHSIQGERSNIELQIIHQELNNPNKELVISILIMINDSRDSIFDTFKDFSNKENKIETLINDPNIKFQYQTLPLIKEIPIETAEHFDLNNIITPFKMYYYYKKTVSSTSSFPSTSCDKEVKYLILNNIMSVKQYQYNYIITKFNQNNSIDYFNKNITVSNTIDYYMLYDTNIVLQNDYLSSKYISSSVLSLLILLVLC